MLMQAGHHKLHGSTREQGPFLALELPAIRLIGQRLLVRGAAF